MLPLLAVLGGWSVAEIAIAVVVIAAIVAIVFVILNYYGLKPPPWFVQIFWIAVAALVAVLVIRFLANL